MYARTIEGLDLAKLIHKYPHNMDKFVLPYLDDLMDALDQKEEILITIRANEDGMCIFCEGARNEGALQVLLAVATHVERERMKKQMKRDKFPVEKIACIRDCIKVVAQSTCKFFKEVVHQEVRRKKL